MACKMWLSAQVLAVVGIDEQKLTCRLNAPADAAGEDELSDWEEDEGVQAWPSCFELLYTPLGVFLEDVVNSKL